jgi:hypothetical protein
MILGHIDAAHPPPHLIRFRGLPAGGSVKTRRARESSLLWTVYGLALVLCCAAGALHELVLPKGGGRSSHI